ncbi:MAG: T9SS type A sorting domain-containing protein [Bacteroidota bacterium]
MKTLQNFSGMSQRFLRTCFAACLLAALVFASVQKVQAQTNITYAEYYIDQDPGFNMGTPISITPGTSVPNIPITFNVTGISPGAHFFGARARNANGVWSMNYFWIMFRPFLVTLAPGPLNTVNKVEYFIDTDPGIGNATNVPVASPAINLADLAINIDPTPLEKGVHIMGSRSRTSDGKWSQTIYWLFVKPYNNIPTPASPVNINYFEYFIDQDPGLGLATPFGITPGVNLSDVSLPLNIAALRNGVHTVGSRVRDAQGDWSQTNYWLFVKPYAAAPAPGAVPNITALEYFLDYDPGLGNGIPIPVAPATVLTDLSFNVDVSAIIPGTHNVVIRARDANGNWSKVNSWQFTKPGTPPVLSTLVSAPTICAGSQINVGWQLSAPVTFNANNNFVIQLSDINAATFNAPTVIGTTNSTVNSGSLICTIPPGVAQGIYRIRVFSTSQPIVGTDNGSNVLVYALPAEPVVQFPMADTTVCQGNQLQLTGVSNGYAPQWMKDNVVIPGATAWTYTVANTIGSSAGAYKLRSTNATTCQSFSTVRNITINPNVPAIPTLSPGGSFGVCLGNSQLLTSSAASFNQWYKNGVAIPGAINQTYNANTSGTYTVQAGNGLGCFNMSSNNAVINIGLPPVIPTIGTGGPITFCQGSNVVLTSSAFSGNQWFKDDVLMAGQTNQSYTASTTGSYTVRVTNGGCDVFSSPLAVTVNPTLTPTISIAVNGNNVPTGTNMIFTATANNGGGAPTYNFRVAGVSVQNSSSNVFSTTTLTTGQQVTCILTSNANCLGSNNPTSNTITVNLLPNITITGRAYHIMNAIIPAVSANLTLDAADNQSTDPNGRYSYNLMQMRNYNIAPYKNNDLIRAKGVDVLDVLQMQAHILGSNLLNTPHKIIAADVNNDAAVNIFDVLAVKRLILGIDNSFTGNRLWAFVDSSYTFPVPANPFPYPFSRNYTNVTTNQVNQSFVGVKLGDVNQDWTPTAGQNEAEQIETETNTVQLYYDTVIAQRGEQVRIKVRVRNFKKLMGMQFTIGFNTASFQYSAIENKQLPVDFNDRMADRGVLSFIWNEAGNGMKTLTDGSAIFDIVLQKKRSISKEDIVIMTGYTPAKAFNRSYEPYAISKTDGVVLEKMPTISLVQSESIHVTPNPSSGRVQVTVLSKTSKRVTLIITDMSGRVVIQKDIDLNIGTNVIPLDLNARARMVAGMYYLRAIGLEYTKAKELVITSQ